MYYHVSIRALVGKVFIDMIEMDLQNEELVLQDVVIPYLVGEEFIFNGYLIARKNIERIVIKTTARSADDLALFENEQMPYVHVIAQDIFNYHHHTTDVTKQLMTEARKLTDIKKVPAHAEVSVDRTKVFIVHGHDELAKTKAARFVEKLGFETIILHEQSSSGQTIIEKIERYSNVGFGIVLYTPCDVGGKNETEPKLSPRARQNVIFEHGFLMGKIGRSNVCALVKDDVETPNDISGVVYVTMDSHDAWMTQVAKEMKESGYEIDMNKL